MLYKIVRFGKFKTHLCKKKTWQSRNAPYDTYYFMVFQITIYGLLVIERYNISLYAD